MSSLSTTFSGVMMDQHVDEAMEFMVVGNVATVHFLKKCVNKHFNKQNHAHSCVNVHEEISELKKLHDSQEIFKIERRKLEEKYVHISTVLNLCKNNPCKSSKTDCKMSYSHLLFLSIF